MDDEGNKQEEMDRKWLHSVVDGNKQTFRKIGHLNWFQDLQELSFNTHLVMVIHFTGGTYIVDRNFKNKAHIAAAFIYFCAHLDIASIAILWQKDRELKK